MKRIGIGGWLALTAMVGLLVLAIWFMFVGWDAPEGAGEITWKGYLAMAGGIVFTMALGAGLMALMFYSHRHGKD
jgi:hypothetical protein